MLQIYSTNLDVAANAAYPLNTVSLDKGMAIVPSGAASVQLNRCRLYKVTCDAFVNPAAAGEVSIQLYKNGIPQPEAISTITGVVDTIDTLGFTTLVQVSENNTRCCCTAPTILQFVNGDTAVTGAHINITVVKVC